jgi:hypothetical protein
MSELRKHLESAKREYHSQHYPGDLAAEIFPRKHIARWLIPPAAAAAIAIVAWMEITTQKNQRQVATAIHMTANPATVPTTEPSSLLGVVPMPANIDFAPPSLDFDISTPSFSLSVDEMKEKTSTTQEST